MDPMHRLAPPNIPYTVEGVFGDFKGRRNALIKALTTDFEVFYKTCDPEKDNLCLYGLPNGRWEVSEPAEDVPPELPEPTVGINFPQGDMQTLPWLGLVAIHSDSWLLSVAFYLGGKFSFNKADRKRLFNMINDLPTIFEAVGIFIGPPTAEKLVKDNSSISKRRGSTRGSTSKSNKKLEKIPEGNEMDEEKEDEHKVTYCGSCGVQYMLDEFWIFCDVCKRWFHGKCVNMTPTKAEVINLYRCPSCTNKRPRLDVLMDA